MNLNWIANPATVYALLAAGGFAGLYLVVLIKAELRDQQRLYTAERDGMAQTIAELRGKMDELSERTSQHVAVPTRYPSEGMNIEKRAEALRMYRRGSDAPKVAAALALPQAEVLLLHKVHRILLGDEPILVPQSVAPPVQPRSSKFEYSLEA